MTANRIEPEKWVDKYADFLFHYTITRVANREVANDLISETFLSALKSMKNFKGRATERTWLVSILKRKIVDYYRSINSEKGKAEVKVNYSNKEQEGDWLEERIAEASQHNAEEIMENRELGMVILDCIDQLSEQQAAIFKMKTFEGRDTEFICNEFQISPSNLWVIMHRARLALIKCLEKNWF